MAAPPAQTEDLHLFWYEHDHPHNAAAAEASSALEKEFFKAANALTRAARSRQPFVEADLARAEVKIVTSAMQQLMDTNVRALESGCVCLEDLSRSTINLVRMFGFMMNPFRDDDVKPIVAAMRKYPLNVRIQRAGSNALSFITGIFTDVPREDEGESDEEDEAGSGKRLVRESSDERRCRVQATMSSLGAIDLATAVVRTNARANAGDAADDGAPGADHLDCLINAISALERLLRGPAPPECFAAAADARTLEALVSALDGQVALTDTEESLAKRAIIVNKIVLIISEYARTGSLQTLVTSCNLDAVIAACGCNPAAIVAASGGAGCAVAALVRSLKYVNDRLSDGGPSSETPPCSCSAGAPSMAPTHLRTAQVAVNSLFLAFLADPDGTTVAAVDAGAFEELIRFAKGHPQVPFIDNVVGMIGNYAVRQRPRLLASGLARPAAEAAIAALLQTLCSAPQQQQQQRQQGGAGGRSPAPALSANAVYTLAAVFGALSPAGEELPDDPEDAEAFVETLFSSYHQPPPPAAAAAAAATASSSSAAAVGGGAAAGGGATGTGGGGGGGEGGGGGGGEEEKEDVNNDPLAIYRHVSGVASVTRALSSRLRAAQQQAQQQAQAQGVLQAPTGQGGWEALDTTVKINPTDPVEALAGTLPYLVAFVTRAEAALGRSFVIDA